MGTKLFHVFSLVSHGYHSFPMSLQGSSGTSSSGSGAETAQSVRVWGRDSPICLGLGQRQPSLSPSVSGSGAGTTQSVWVWGWDNPVCLGLGHTQARAAQTMQKAGKTDRRLSFCYSKPRVFSTRRPTNPVLLVVDPGLHATLQVMRTPDDFGQGNCGAWLWKSFSCENHW